MFVNDSLVVYRRRLRMMTVLSHLITHDDNVGQDGARHRLDNGRKSPCPADLQSEESTGSLSFKLDMSCPYTLSVWMAMRHVVSVRR